jgi:aspartyl-tRNA(Asn)/glutamyl-tRNA(Gln) amidotransferase subunit A
MTAAEYIRLVEGRADFIRRFDTETKAFDALVMPTVPMTAPPVAAFARDEDYARLNLKPGGRPGFAPALDTGLRRCDEVRGTKHAI